MSNADYIIIGGGGSTSLMIPANRYVITKTDITAQSETVLRALSTTNSSLGSGKALLSQLRCLSVHQAVNPTVLDTAVIESLLTLLRQQMESDNDRKVLRTLVHLLTEALAPASGSLSLSNTAHLTLPVSVSGSGNGATPNAEHSAEVYRYQYRKFLDLIHHELQRTSNHPKDMIPRRALAWKTMGTLCALPVLTTDKDRDREREKNMVKVGPNPDDVQAALEQLYEQLKVIVTQMQSSSLSHESKADREYRILQLSSIFSALRRIGQPLPSMEIQEQTMHCLKSTSSKFLTRHILAVILNTVSLPSSLSRVGSGSLSLSSLLYWTEEFKRQINAAPIKIDSKHTIDFKNMILKDDLSASLWIQCVAAIVMHSMDREREKDNEKSVSFPEEVVDLAIEVIKLLPQSQER
jgi:hypothetical protein